MERFDKYTPAQIAEAEEKREKHKQTIEEAEKYRKIIAKAIEFLSIFPKDKKMNEINSYRYNSIDHLTGPKDELEKIFGGGEGLTYLTDLAILGGSRYRKENDDMTIREIIDTLEKQRETLASDDAYEIKSA